MAISLCLGLRKDQLRPAGSGDPSTTPNSVILPHRSPDSGCFALLSAMVHVHSVLSLLSGFQVEKHEARFSNSIIAFYCQL